MKESALSEFIAAIRSGEKLSDEQRVSIEQLLSAYPYFSLAAATLLKEAGANPDDRKRLSAAVALNAPDTDSLMKLIDPDGERFAAFYPAADRPETPTTEKALDTFLDQYGTMDRKEQDLLERLIFNPVPDYSQVLAREAAESDEPLPTMSEQDSMLDAFLASQQQGAQSQREPAPASRPPAPTDADAPLSESLAKIYVKQGRFDKAYEIIYQLSLNFPKKSVYFADQLRFLKKLILISKANGEK